MPSLGDVPPALRPLLGELAASLRERLHVAANALDVGDQAKYRAAIHAAKGMAMTFGLHGLAGRVAQAEDLSGCPDDARAALRRLVRLVDAVAEEGER
ncbi:hypothetical protein JCM15519_19870 [Fundidesulfovibrio butyratiphilus]